MTASSGMADVGAFVPGGEFVLSPMGEGPLSGLRFAVKDLIDIEGTITGAGNPDWAAAMEPARASAPVVDALLKGGATCIGKTITDELAFSLEGSNVHYGTPLNAAAPNCLPGGSSSGSAAAVAARLADFALGTDTGGSVRVPGAFCEIFSIRPSHGALSLEGVTPFAPSYDTIGWFARDAETLALVGDTLLPEASPAPITEIAVADDTFALCDTAFGPSLLELARTLANIPPVLLFAAHWSAYFDAYNVLQGRDIRESLGPALARIKPGFAPDMAERFAGALGDTRDIGPVQALRDHAAAHLRATLPPGRAALIPSTPIRHLARDVDGATLGVFYPRALAIGAIAGHSGAPQVQFPTPFGGLSLIAAPGSDRALLDCVRTLIGTMS